MEMQKNKLSVSGVSEVRWTGQGEIRNGDYTVYYSGAECAERVVAIVVHKSIVRSVVKKISCNDRIIAIKLKAEPVEDVRSYWMTLRTGHERILSIEWTTLRTGHERILSIEWMTLRTGHERKLSIEGGNSRSHYVEESFWKRL